MSEARTKRPSGGRESTMGKSRNARAEEQKWLCFWCNRPMRDTPEDGQSHSQLEVTADHIVNLSRGGTNRRANIVAAS